MTTDDADPMLSLLRTLAAPPDQGLAPGSRLGPYEIVAPLGAGGMGEVYRARDTRLGREVAVKILPAESRVDPQRRARFDKEARLAGKLNHPNTLVVYDVGEHDGAPYLVSEILDGETLRARLLRTEFAPREALEVAVQAARGMAAAHDKGIVHRDLKPENLFVTRDGRVKILDFGLARLTQNDEASAEAGLTSPGVILGTAAYMSPEQARGAPVDHRSDIFSLGSILYELVAGERAFTGASAVEIMNAVITEDPPPLAGQRPIDRIVRRCLAKRAEDRFQTAGELIATIEEVAAAESRSQGAGGPSTVSLVSTPEAPAVAAALRVVHPPELARRVALDARPLLLGRLDGSSREALDHPTVSRRHAEVRWDPQVGRHLARDRRSHNGTHVDGLPVRQAAAALREGSVLRLGDVLAVVEREPPRVGWGRRVAIDQVPGDSPAVVELRARLARAARDPAPVLVTGETGTGKERIVRELHRLSKRAGSLVSVNCASVSPAQIPELFLAAERGTLFLDEVGDLPSEVQARLLRAVERGEIHPVGSPVAATVDVRIVATTNRALADEVAAGRFRRDLHGRLAMWELRVPPLRERRGDIPGWLARLGPRPLSFSADAMQRILLDPWPDNLRGLERLVRALASRADPAATVDVADLPI